MRIKNRIFVVFSCIYRQKHGPTVESTPDTPKTAAVVLELLEPVFGHGHTLWIDFFNSPELARKLKIDHSTDCVAQGLNMRKKRFLRLNKIFIFYTKDFFNSPELARKLKIEHSTDCVAEGLNIGGGFKVKQNIYFLHKRHVGTYI